MNNESLFRDINKVIDKLIDSGNEIDAHKLKEGFSLLNGLTDGWALLLNSINTILKDPTMPLDRKISKKLISLQKVIYKIINR